MTTRDDLHLLTGAYAVDALTGDELADFERYLVSSEDARTEVIGMTETAVLLGSVAPPVIPSRQLRSTLLGLIATTEQLPPIPDAAPTTDAATGATAAADPAPSQAVPSAAPASESGRAESKARARWFTRSAALVAAAAAAVALFFGGNTVVSNLQQAESLRAQAGSLAALSSAADLQTKVQAVAGGGSATLLFSGELQRAALVLSELPPLERGKTYEAWFIDASGARPAGTFDAIASGTTWHLLPGSMTTADAVGVTVEPAGGSAQPTTKPIVALSKA